MWKTLSAGRWICVTALVAVMLISVSKVEAQVGTPCCYSAGRFIGQAIIDCIKQQPRRDCNSNNYVVRVQSGKWYCISSKSRWMQWQIRMRKICCRPEFEK